MRPRRKSLIVRRDISMINKPIGPYNVGYWDWPTPTQRREPIFRSLGCRDNEDQAKELARVVAKQYPTKYIWQA